MSPITPPRPPRDAAPDVPPPAPAPRIDAGRFRANVLRMESEARNRGVPFADVFWERLAAAAAAGEPNARELIDIQKQAGNRRALDL